jgi:hypothetical protein
LSKDRPGTEAADELQVVAFLYLVDGLRQPSLERDEVFIAQRQEARGNERCPEAGYISRSAELVEEVVVEAAIRGAESLELLAFAGPLQEVEQRQGTAGGEGLDDALEVGADGSVGVGEQVTQPADRGAAVA